MFMIELKQKERNVIFKEPTTTTRGTRVRSVREVSVKEVPRSPERFAIVPGEGDPD